MWLDCADKVILTSTSTAQPTMSSLEIADLTGKRHDHVMRDIRAMLDALEITGPKFGGSYIDPTGRSLPCFHLPKDLTLTVVAGYSVPLRHKIVARWMELEYAEMSRARLATPQTFVQALQLALDRAKQISRRQGTAEVQQEQLLLAAPKVVLVELKEFP